MEDSFGAAEGAAARTGGDTTAGAAASPPCFSGGRRARTGGRSGKPPPLIGEAERILGRAFPVPDPVEGRLAVGNETSGGGRSSSTGPRWAPAAESLNCGTPNQTRILTAVSESTELEWVFGSSTPTSANIARISPGFDFQFASQFVDSDVRCPRQNSVYSFAVFTSSPISSVEGSGSSGNALVVVAAVSAAATASLSLGSGSPESSGKSMVSES